MYHVIMIGGEEGKLPAKPQGKSKILAPETASTIIKGLTENGVHDWLLFQEFTKGLPPETPMADILKLFKAKKDIIAKRKGG